MLVGTLTGTDGLAHLDHALQAVDCTLRTDYRTNGHSEQVFPVQFVRSWLVWTLAAYKGCSSDAVKYETRRVRFNAFKIVIIWKRTLDSA